MLRGKRAMIVGATADLGAGIVSQFANSRVSKLILHGRDRDRLSTIAASALELGVSVIPLVADLSNPSELAALKCELRHILTFPLDIFVYTPAILGDMNPTSFLKIEQDILLVFQVNFTACVELFQVAIAHFSGNSAAVFLTSTNAFEPLECGSAYCTSKCALSMFMKCSAIELGGKGTRVNAVAPGLVATKMHSHYFESDDELRQFFVKKAEQNPLGRLASVQGVANAVAFLCSDLARDITGTQMVVDCGATLYMQER
jgi:NAD(P)-dependent dehydrogenase (short-subunit alcohol dehydrogenase family)